MEIKPCPFCGSTNLRTPSKGGLNVQKWWVLSIRCLDCRAEGPSTDLKQYKTNGQLYAHGSRRPKSASGQARWDATIQAAVQKAIQLWNGNR